MFENIIEQNRIKRILESSIRQNKVGHAYLFYGDKGMGKKMLAKSFAQALLCTAAPDYRPCGKCIACSAFEKGMTTDLIQVGLMPNEKTIKIKQIRELKMILSEKTFDANLRICLLTDADKMTTEAQNALLKTLEEPYPGNLFLLTAENKEDILLTIRSRCQLFQMDPVSPEGMRTALYRKGLDGASQQSDSLISTCDGNIGMMLAMLTDEKTEKIKADAFVLFYDIINDKAEEIFPFAEKMGKLKSESIDLVKDLIMMTERILKAHSLKTSERDARIDRFLPLIDEKQAVAILEALFEFSDALQYNINLRLGWESVLLKIYEITERQNDK